MGSKLRQAGTLALAGMLALGGSAAVAQGAAAVGHGGAGAQASEPAAPAPAADPLPRANPKYFTADTPAVETVNEFLRQIWGFDPNRLYRVMAVQPTAAPGVTKVVVFVYERGQPDARVQSTTFFVTPDGHHAIGEGTGVVPFGAKPFAPVRELLQQQADGAWRGDPSKALELVEFADLQCPVCKKAQATMDQIAKDFPKAHIVFQLFPLVDIHPSAFKAAEFGVCAQKVSNEAFFKYADGVFDTQEGLTPQSEDTLLKAAALRAGLDGPATVACAALPATHAEVEKDIRLAQAAGVTETPTLSVNGRLIPIGGAIPYDEVKQIIQYQATLDGVDSGATAETLAPAKPQLELQSLPK